MGFVSTTYRQITDRGVRAVENGEFEHPDWGQDIIVDWQLLHEKPRAALLQGEEPLMAWRHYYELADNDDVSKVRVRLPCVPI